MPKECHFLLKNKTKHELLQCKTPLIVSAKKIMIAHHVLSYDVTVIQWIMLSHKNLMTTCVIMQICNVIDNVCVSNAFSY